MSTCHHPSPLPLHLPTPERYFLDFRFSYLKSPPPELNLLMAILKIWLPQNIPSPELDLLSDNLKFIWISDSAAANHSPPHTPEKFTFSQSTWNIFLTLDLATYPPLSSNLEHFLHCGFNNLKPPTIMELLKENFNIGEICFVPEGYQLVLHVESTRTNC